MIKFFRQFINRISRTKQIEKVNLIKDGFIVTIGENSTSIKWSSIDRLVGYKIDQITIDEICLQIEFNNDYTTVTEEYSGWRDFINELLKHFPSIDKNWVDIIGKPAFERNETELFNRLNK